jgi:hypothetical protein
MPASRFYLVTAALLLAACAKKISTTDLRLAAKSEGGREWVEVVAPPEALPINGWIRQCAARVEVIYQSPRVLSLACRESPQSIYASFRLLDGYHLRMTDVIQTGADGALREAADKAFRRKKREPGPINPDFALNAQGMIFSSGPDDIIIPQTELRPMVKPESALLVGR